MPEDEGPKDRTLVPPEVFEQHRLAREQRTTAMTRYIHGLELVRERLDEKYIRLVGLLGRDHPEEIKLRDQLRGLVNYISLGIKILEEPEKYTDKDFEDYMKAEWKEEPENEQEPPK